MDEANETFAELVRAYKNFVKFIESSPNIFNEKVKENVINNLDTAYCLSRGAIFTYYIDFTEKLENNDI